MQADALVRVANVETLEGADLAESPAPRVVAVRDGRVIAEAAGMAGELGRVEPGHLADFTLFAADPLHLSPEAQAANAVIATVVAGELIHHDPNHHGPNHHTTVTEGSL